VKITDDKCPICGNVVSVLNIPGGGHGKPKDEGYYVACSCGFNVDKRT
jgi:hypothetical protein